MADTAARNRDYISGVLEDVTAMAKARRGLKGFRGQIDALGAENVLTPEAFDGANSMVGPEAFPGLLAAFDALEAVLTDPTTGAPTAHGQALAKFVRPGGLR
jgi:hypothetical protein